MDSNNHANSWLIPVFAFLHGPWGCNKNKNLYAISLRKEILYDIIGRD
jgi:hypothetical protein